MAGDVHTPDHPYCDDPNDSCHTDLAYHNSFTHGTFEHPQMPEGVPFDEALFQAAFDIFGIDEEEEE